MKKRMFLTIGFVLFTFFPIALQSADVQTSNLATPTKIPSPATQSGGGLKKPYSKLDRIDIYLIPGLRTEDKNNLFKAIGYYQMLGAPNFNPNAYEVWVLAKTPLEELVKNLKTNPKIKEIKIVSSVLNSAGKPQPFPSPLPTYSMLTPHPIPGDARISDFEKLKPDNDYVQDQVIVQMDNNLLEEEQDLLLQKMIYGVALFESDRHWPTQNLYTLQIINGMSVQDVIKALQGMPHVKAVEQNSRLQRNYFE